METQKSTPSVSFSVILMCENMNRSECLVRELIRFRKAETIEKIILLVKSQHQDSFASQPDVTVVKMSSGESLTHARNRCAEESASVYLLYITDRVLVESLSVLPTLFSEMVHNNWDALSPNLWAEYEKQQAFKGESLSEAVFYGFSQMNSVDTKEQLKDNIAESLAPDCFMIKTSVLQQLGGFDEQLTPSHYSVLALCCKMKEEGLTCGYAADITLRISKMSGGRHQSFGDELWSVLYRYATLFRRTADFMDRAFLCPQDYVRPEHNQGRVLLVSHELTQTGAPIVLLDLAIELKSLGYEVMFASCMDGLLADAVLKSGFPLLMDSLWTDGRLANDEDINLSVPFLLDNIIGSFNRTVFNSIVTHNLVTRYNGMEYPIYWWTHEGAFFWPYMNKSVPQILTDNIQVLAGGEYVQNIMKQYGYNYNTKILEYGVTDQINEFAGKGGFLPARKSEDITRFLLPATIHLRKGHDILMKAIQSLPLSYIKRMEVVFLGEPREPELSTDVINFCEAWPNMYFFANVERDELYKLYQDIDVVVCSSRDDPLPVILAEGMMFRRVCICSTGTGFRYYLRDGDNGYVFKNENVEDLVRCLMDIIDRSGDLSDMQEKSRAIFEQHFDNAIFRRAIKNFFKYEETDEIRRIHLYGKD